jgi:ParB family transcriptional regulator, chromosome partitioning protein
MDIKKGLFIEMEISELQLSLRHTRIRKTQEVNRLKVSIERFGQATPVVVILDEEKRYLLVDGYRRILAMKSLGLMQAMAEVWPC